MTKDEAKMVCAQPAQEPVAWLATETVRWLREYDGPSCAMRTAVHNRPIMSDGGVPVYLEPAEQGWAEVERWKAAAIQKDKLHGAAMSVVRAQSAENESLRDELTASAAEIAALRAENERLIRLIRLVHPVMRECGWQLAPACAAEGSDGILEAACAEIEEEFGDMLRTDGVEAGQ